EPTPFMLDALVAYMREFEFLANPQIDDSGVLTDLASDAARRGQMLFNQPFAGLNGKSCAVCHDPLNKFRDGRTYDIGSAPLPFAGATPRMLETPTLLNARFSQPYFNDGSLATLGSVVRWFNDTKSLGLDETEISDLTAYLQAVGDGEDPYEQFDATFTPFRLTYEELVIFASTLNTLLPMRDQANIALLVGTVTFDMVRDASLMKNLAAKPDVYRLAELLRAVGTAAAAGDWGVAGTKWQAFQTLQAEINERIY
ncbi:MAG: cytochrome c peroxidase, partial [Halocynthiibacter sp.]